MVLKEGKAGGIAVGIILILAGLVGAVALYLSSGWSNAVWLPILVIILGIAAIFGSSSIGITINKPNNQIADQVTRIIGGSATTYALADVLRVETRKHWQTELQSGGTGRGFAGSIPQQVLFTQSFILFKDGRELAIDRQRRSSSVEVGLGGFMTGGFGAGSNKEATTANNVATFMGVPFEQVNPPSGGGFNIGGIQL